MQASATPSTPSTPPRTPTWSESGHPSPALSYGSDSSDSTIMSSITSFEYQGIDYLALLWSEVNLIVAAIHIEAYVTLNKLAYFQRCSFICLPPQQQAKEAYRT
jgi:hypothetical protein